MSVASRYKSVLPGRRKKGACGSFFISIKRIECAFDIYGRDEDFILQDDFVESLKQDAIALEERRLKIYPTLDTPLPGALLMFTTGLLALTALGWHRACKIAVLFLRDKLLPPH